MMKEVPHDFFLTHPDDFFAGTIARPTLMEFDVGAEFNGEGLIANTWPEHILARARGLLKRPHVIGYVARTDRYGRTRVIGRPSEINLLALKRYADDANVTAEAVYDEFISTRYGTGAVALVKAAFRNAFDIVTSTLYTLGTNTANHSALDYDPYASSDARSVSGKWLDPPVVFVRHDVDREFHYWTDVIDRLAPPWAKVPKTAPQLAEVPWVIERGRWRLLRVSGVRARRKFSDAGRDEDAARIDGRIASRRAGHTHLPAEASDRPMELGSRRGRGDALSQERSMKWMGLAAGTLLIAASATGFVVDEGQVWGRPVGVAMASDGALLVSDDVSKSIWRVSYGK